MNLAYKLLCEDLEDMEVKIVRRRTDEKVPVEFHKYDRILPEYTTSNVYPEAKKDWMTGTRPVWRSSGEGQTSAAQSLGEALDRNSDKDEKKVSKINNKLMRALKKTGYPVQKLIKASKRASDEISKLLDTRRPSPQQMRRILEKNFNNLIPDAKDIGGEESEDRNKNRMKVIYIRIFVFAALAQSIILMVGLTKLGKSETYRILIKVMTTIVPTIIHQVLIQLGGKWTSRIMTWIAVAFHSIYDISFNMSAGVSAKKSFAGAGLYGAFKVINREIQIFLIENGYDHVAFAFTSFLEAVGNYIDAKITTV